MRARRVLSLLLWPVGLALVAGLIAGAYAVRESVVARRAAEAKDDEPPPKRAANAIIKLGAEFAEAQGIKDEPAVAVAWERRATAFGRVVPNPRGTAEIRAAFAGTVRTAPDKGWPALGARVGAGKVLGYVDVRFGPQERLDLLSKLTDARAKAKGADDLVRLHQERLDRLQGAGSGISQSELDTARTALAEARTQLATAKAVEKEWQDALDAIDRPGGRKDGTWSQPLTAPLEGEVVELTARPGTSVEPGAVIARVVDFRVALVRLELPPESLTAGPPPDVELFAVDPSPPAFVGAPNQPAPAPGTPTRRGRLTGTAPQIEVASQFAAYWYEVENPPDSKATWRPGLFVKALVKVPETKPRSAIEVPEGALLYHQGRALVYVRIGPGRFERREVQVLGHDQTRWVLASGVEAGERVVSQRAQVLLSEEFRTEADND
jgi:biotin carboxyl carrier protein